MAATLAVVAILAAVNVLKHEVPGSVSLSVVAAAVLLILARRAGLTWEQLGLSRTRLRSGGLWGLSAVLVVAAVYVAGVLLPATRSAFLDARYHMGMPQALFTAFLVIPLGTVLLEEVAFRSVLWGMLSRHATRWWVLGISSVLFGLWHVLPSLGFASANRSVADALPQSGTGATVLVVLGTVAFTAVGGLVAGELRRRSGHVLASVGMHWATNSLGVLFGVVAWRLAG